MMVHTMILATIICISLLFLSYPSAVRGCRVVVSVITHSVDIESSLLFCAMLPLANDQRYDGKHHHESDSSR
jgi:hypothetical protein